MTEEKNEEKDLLTENNSKSETEFEKLTKFEKFCVSISILVLFVSVFAIIPVVLFTHGDNSEGIFLAIILGAGYALISARIVMSIKIYGAPLYILTNSLYTVGMIVLQNMGELPEHMANMQLIWLCSSIAGFFIFSLITMKWDKLITDAKKDLENEQK